MKKLEGVNKPINIQIDIFKEILMKNKTIKKVLKSLEESTLTNYYVAAGCINQVLFNYYNEFDFEYGIKDIDIVYFDNDTSYEAEDKIIKYLQELLNDIDKELDIKNQARVHLWYKEKFGYDINPFGSVEEAIASWGTTVMCVGVRIENGELVVFAPYGLNDIFSGIIRPVKTGVFNEESYNAKALKCKKRWPSLQIVPWK